MNSQFKFKPDKIKYLSNIDTLDSSHKKITDNINKKRDDVPKKRLKLENLKKELEDLDNKRNEYSNVPNFINIRAKIIEEISELENELVQIENYEEETEYYSKTYQILFNYYDILDGQIENEINVKYSETEQTETEIDNNLQKNIHNTLVTDTSEINENSDNSNLISNSKNNEWNYDGIEIFNCTKSSKLDLLNEISKMKRKEKKTTRKRVKNVESLVKDNNYNIFDFIHSNIKNDDNQNNNNNNNNIKNTYSDEYNIYDRAVLYEDYKTTLEGYSFKKKNTKPCINCNIDKVLVYSEGIYACMKCGEVENCIVESEITNYKDPMVEKPTFPYKRKNHFCEWTFNCSLKLLLKKVATLYYN